jgi:hypothetical protein
MTPELVARGLRQPNSLKQTYDFNPTGGGPIVRDKLWFYSAARFQTNQNYVAGIFDNKNAGNVNAWLYEPDLSSQGLFAIVQKSANTRVTWQANERNKVTGFFEKQWRTWDDGAANRAPESFTRYRFPRNQIALFGWTSPMTNRLLLEARGSYHAEIWENVGGRELLSNNDQLIPIMEQGGAIPGLTYRSMYGAYARQEAPAIMQGQASGVVRHRFSCVQGRLRLAAGHPHESVDGQCLRAPVPVQQRRAEPDHRGRHPLRVESGTCARRVSTRRTSGR